MIHISSECDSECDEGDDNPEQLLPHSDDAADPGEQGEGLHAEAVPGGQNLVVKVHPQTVAVSPGGKPALNYFISDAVK